MPKLQIKKPTQPATTLNSSKAREHRDHPADGPSLAYECDVCHHRAATKHGLRSHFDKICFPNRRHSHPLFLSRSKMITPEQIVLLNRDVPFRFMDLPPEIRLRVYGYIFVPRGPIRIKKFEAIQDGLLSKRLLGLYQDGRAAHVRCFEFQSASSILTVSKTIHHEAIEIPYRDVTFVFNSDIGTLDGFFSKNGPPQQSNITSISLDYSIGGYYGLHSIRDLLRSTPRLARLSVNFATYSLRSLSIYYDQFGAFPNFLEYPESPEFSLPAEEMWEITAFYRVILLCFGRAEDIPRSAKHLQTLELTWDQGKHDFAPVNLVERSEQLKKWQGDGECATFMASDLDKALEELMKRCKRSKMYNNLTS